MAKTLTKEYLIKLGITKVTESGQVYINNKLAKPHILVTYHPYGENKYYVSINITDKNRPKTKHGRYYRGSVCLSRIVLAWFKGKIEGNMDADHIDNDPFNNSISNLQIISRKENLERRAKTQKQIFKEWYELKKVKELIENDRK